MLFAERRLVQALQAWDVAGALEVLKKKPHLAKKRLVDPATRRSTWAVLMAARCGQGDIVEYMVGLGADPEVGEEPEQWRPLHHAAINGHAAVAAVLVAHEVAVDAPDSGGRSAFHWSILNDHLEVARVLVDAGAEVNLQLPGPGTLLHHEADEGREATIEFLLTAGADPNGRNGEGETPLHLAARTDHVSAARLLLDYGAEVDARDARGRTPLDCARLGAKGAAVGLIAGRGGSSGA